jgi:hypothetical protein
MVQGLKPGGGEIFCTHPDQPWSSTSLLYNGYHQFFPRGKVQPGRDADPSPPSSAIGHKRVELYLYSPMGHTACTEPQCLYKGALSLFPPQSTRIRISIRYNENESFILFISSLIPLCRTTTHCKEKMTN